jgi:hypothetical protein
MEEVVAALFVEYDPVVQTRFPRIKFRVAFPHDPSAKA